MRLNASSLLVCMMGFIGLSACLPATAALPTGYEVTKVNLLSNDLVFNNATGEYLASVGSAAGFGSGNSITRIGDNGTILQSTFVGSEPGKIALAKDGSKGYVALNGAPAITVFDGSNGANLSKINLTGTWNGANYAEDLSVSPDDADTIAVSLRNSCCSPRHEGVAIFKNGVMLPTKTPGHTGSNTIEFGSSGSVLYGYNNETSEFAFRTMSVSSTGVTVSSLSTAPLYGYNKTIQYDQGYIFGSSGEVIDAETATRLGQISLDYGALLAPAVAQGHVYALGGYGQLSIYDLTTFTPITTFNLSSLIGSTGFTKLIVGADGDLAIQSTRGIFLLSAVPEASTLATMSLGLIGLLIAARKRQHA